MKHRGIALPCVFLVFLIIMQLFLPACSSANNQEDTGAVYDETTAVVTQAVAEPVTETTAAATSLAATESTAPVINQAVTTQPVLPSGSMADGSLSGISAEETTGGKVANEEMAKLMDEIGVIVQVCGFEYDEQDDLFFSTKYPFQRFFGYNSFYDLMAYRVGMYYNTQKIYFSYDDKDWMLQIWKGQYGITVGAEIGFYFKPSNRLIQHYDSVNDDDMVVMAFDVYKNGDFYFSRGPQRHWWLTGFKLLDVAIFLQLNMVITLCWDNEEIADAFEEGINDFHITDMTYIRDGNTFVIDWTI